MGDNNESAEKKISKGKYVATNGIRLVSMALSLESAIERSIAAQGGDDNPCHVAIWKLSECGGGASLVCYLSPTGTVMMAHF